MFDTAHEVRKLIAIHRQRHHCKGEDPCFCRDVESLLNFIEQYKTPGLKVEVLNIMESLENKYPVGSACPNCGTKVEMAGMCKPCGGFICDEEGWALANETY